VKKVIVSSLLSLGLLLSANPQAAQTIQSVLGWIKTGNPAYTLETDAQVHRQPATESLRLQAPAGAKPSDWSQVYQDTPMTSYAKQRVKVSAFLKANNPDGLVTLWTTTFPERSNTFSLNAVDSFAGSTEAWRLFEVVFDVPPGTVVMNYGVAIKGAGQVWIDQIHITAVDKTVAEKNIKTPSTTPKAP